jgi:glycosyltransferase involved in cell wall biosynthesis
MGRRLHRMTRQAFRQLVAPWRLRSQLLVGSDGASWIVDGIVREISTRMPRACRASIVTGEWTRVSGCVIHLVSRSWLSVPESVVRRAAARNAIIPTWWHGDADSIDAELRGQLRYLATLRDCFPKIHAPCQSSALALESVGVEPDRIRVLAEGIDTSRFTPRVDNEEKLRARAQLGLPAEAMILGCFQKDGVGWAEGNEPKLVKGPDILVAAMSQVHRVRKIHMAIPGPSRGYLKRGFDNLDIPYSAPGFVADSEMPLWHKAADLYVSPSREEGGPAGVLEALSTGVPVVATKTGVAPDIMMSGREGILVDVGDQDGLAAGVLQLLQDEDMAAECSRRAVVTASKLDWTAMAERYWAEMYLPVSESLDLEW